MMVGTDDGRGLWAVVDSSTVEMDCGLRDEDKVTSVEDSPSNSIDNFCFRLPRAC